MNAQFSAGMLLTLAMVSFVSVLRAEEKIEVVVSNVNIAKGTIIKDPAELFRLAKVDKELVPPSAFRGFEKLKGRKFTRDVDKNNVVVERDFAIFELPTGTRASTLRVVLEDSVAGFILPGSQVDLLATEKKDGKNVIKTILQDVLVVAVNADEGEKKAKESKSVTAFVTLALTPEQVEKATGAAKGGWLSLVLRKPSQK